VPDPLSESPYYRLPNSR